MHAISRLPYPDRSDLLINNWCRVKNYFSHRLTFLACCFLSVRAKWKSQDLKRYKENFGDKFTIIRVLSTRNSPSSNLYSNFSYVDQFFVLFLRLSNQIPEYQALFKSCHHRFLPFHFSFISRISCFLILHSLHLSSSGHLQSRIGSWNVSFANIWSQVFYF